MAENIDLNLNLNTNNADNSLNALTQKLSDLKSRIGDVGAGSAEFKKLQQEIIETDTKLKNLNKSIEGVDTERLVGEIGKFAGGMTQAFAGLTLLAGKGNKSIEELQETLNKSIGIVMAVKGAMDAYTASVNLAKVAQTALNTTMKSNPWGVVITALSAVVIAIGALIKKEKELTDAEKASIAAIKERQESMKQNYTIYQENIKAVEDFIVTLNNQSKTQLQVALDQLTAAKMSEMAVGSQATAIKSLTTQIADLEAKQKSLGKAPTPSDYMKNGRYDVDAYNMALKNYQIELEDLPYQLEQARTKLESLEEAEKKHTNIINEKYNALEAELRQTIARNKALEEQKKLLEARNKFEMDYLDRIRQLQINAIDDERYREEQQALFDYEMSVKKIENEVKALKYGKDKEEAIIGQFVLWYKENYADKLRDIDNKYNSDKVKGTKTTYDEIEKITISYVDKAIELMKKFQEEEEKADSIRLAMYNNLINTLQKMFSADTFNFIDDNLQTAFQTAFASIGNIFDTWNKEYDANTEQWVKNLDKVQSVMVALADTMGGVFQMINDNIEQSLESNIEKSTKAFQDQMDMVQESYEEGVINKEQYEAAMDSIEKKQAEQEKRLKHDAFEKERTAAIVQATINGIVGAIAQYEAGPVAGIALSAVVAALAAVQIALISSQENPYAKGGILRGASHAQGGIEYQVGGRMVELEGNEMVINKKATAIPEYRSMASAINVATGGVPFEGSKPFSMLNRDDLDYIVNSIAAIPVIVSENDITKTQRKVSVTQSRSKF